MSYTPGPWTLKHRTSYFKNGNTAYPRDLFELYSDGVNFAEIHCLEDTAKLIVNAPEMVDILKDLAGNSFDTTVSPEVVKSCRHRAKQILQWVCGPDWMKRPEKLHWEPSLNFYCDNGLEFWECPLCKNAVIPTDDGTSPYEWGWRFCPECGVRLDGPNKEERVKFWKDLEREHEEG